MDLQGNVPGLRVDINVCVRSHTDMAVIVALDTRVVRAVQGRQLPLRAFTESKLSAARAVDLFLIARDDESAHLIRAGMVLFLRIDDENGAIVFRPVLRGSEAQFDALSRAFRFNDDV